MIYGVSGEVLAVDDLETFAMDAVNDERKRKRVWRCVGPRKRLGPSCANCDASMSGVPLVCYYVEGMSISPKPSSVLLRARNLTIFLFIFRRHKRKKNMIFCSNISNFDSPIGIYTQSHSLPLAIVAIKRLQCPYTSHVGVKVPRWSDRSVDACTSGTYPVCLQRWSARWIHRARGWIVRLGRASLSA